MIELLGYGALLGYAMVSLLLVGLYRWLALHYRWLDHPNQRSSHKAITPRGAGIIFGLLIVGAAAWLLRHQRAPLLLSLLLSLAILLTGWVDDIRGMATRTRFALYFFFAAIAIGVILGIPINASQLDLIIALIYCLIATLGLTWLINLYNFMDGINGLAALEAIFVLLGVNLLAQTTPYGQTFGEIHLFSCAVLAGFLAWNFPAGKVFMGDAGSAFLGFFLGVLMLWSMRIHGPSLAIWFILLAAFITDTGYTLFVRFITRQPWYSAHRLHAYQRLTDRLKSSHPHTTLAIMIFNVCWLLPMAWLVHTHLISQAWGLTFAYAPLLTVCYWLKAGIPRRGEV